MEVTTNMLKETICQTPTPLQTPAQTKEAPDTQSNLIPNDSFISDTPTELIV
jgi:hypothetical protein